MSLLTQASAFFGTEAVQDPYPLYDRMRADPPVQRIGESPFYAVCGFDAVNGGSVSAASGLTG